MNTALRSLSIFAATALLALFLSGCSAQAKKARYLEQADRYFTDGKYEEAEIDYKNVLQLEALNPRAITQLGLIYFNQGLLGRSFIFLQKASELQPDNLDLHVKLGQLYFAFGQVPEAREQATFVLERRPENPDAILLLADTARNTKDIEMVRARLKSLPPSSAQSAPVILAQGMFDLRSRQLDVAEQAFKRAIELDPKSADAHAALGGLHRIKNDRVPAEQELKIAADLSPPRSTRRLQYAQYKIQLGDYTGARAYLEEMVRKTPDYVPALIVLSQLAALEKKFDEASATIAKVLARDTMQPDAMLLNARIELARGNPTKCISEAEKILRSYPKSAQAHYQIAQAYLALNQSDKAIASLTQAVTLFPNYVEAQIQLADLNNRKGNYSPTIIAMKHIAQLRPEMSEPWLFLAAAYVGQDNFTDALAVYDHVEKLYPQSAQAPYLKGLVYLRQGKRDDARASFLRALELAPDIIPPVEQLVALDVGDKNYAAAIERAENLVNKNPKRPEAHILLARIYMEQKDVAKAEPILKKAIDLQPENPTPYYMLASLYFDTNQHEKALANLAELTAKNPKDAQAWMISGVLNDQLKNSAGARESYEKVIAINPKFTPALNNLAYIYAEKFNELDKALDVAQRARDLNPQEPHGADTLGWILFRKDQYARALPLLEESAGKLPSSPEIQYHYAMAEYMNGDEEGARRAFERALALNQNFPGADEARKRLAFLTSPAEKISRSDLEKAVASQPDDVVALTRLAAVYERDGATDKAIATNEAALKASPGNVRGMLNLVRLYSAKKDTAKAFDLAKAARKAAPNDPAIAYALGRLAFQTGDYTWAASLLQEAVRRSPDDPEVLYDHALAAYSVGRVEDASLSLRSALNGKPSFTKANEARQMNELIDLAADPTSSAVADAALKADPANVPAMMARAAFDEKNGKAAEAKQLYEKALARYPDFAPAKRGLAIYYAANPVDDQTGFELATKAREAYPNDAGLAKALGIILYRRGEFPRAASLLSESSRSKTDDPQVFYYLGMTQSRLKRNSESKRSLLRALELGLKGTEATEARRVASELK